MSLAEKVNTIESKVVVSPSLMSLFGSVLGTLALVIMVSGVIVSTIVTVNVFDPVLP